MSVFSGKRARLDRLAETALDAVQGALEAGDARVAIAVLRGVGLLDGQSPTIGSDDPEVVQEEADLARGESEVRRQDRRLFAP